jgi:hypothetical protein
MEEKGEPPISLLGRYAAPVWGLPAGGAYPGPPYRRPCPLLGRVDCQALFDLLALLCRRQ